MQEEEFEQEDTSEDTPLESTSLIQVQDSKERVALELFKIVYDQANDMPDDLSRHELLTLYNQCYNIVHGVDPDEIFVD
jgi:hypothetical protein